MKDVGVKDLGRFMREIEWLVAEREVVRPPPLAYCGKGGGTSPGYLAGS